MEYIGDVIYDYASGLYVNLTNRCPCACEFCIRTMADSLGGADSLWLKREPSVEEVIELLKEWDLHNYEEIVFCGYGEPLVRLEDVLEISRYVKQHTGLRVRINTNGLADLIHGKPTAWMLNPLVDAVSISLNAPTAEHYNELCHPDFGMKAWPAILKYTADVKTYVADVTMSVVSGSIASEDVELCRKIAEEDLGVKFRVR